MNKCKHHYVFVFESFVEPYDLRLWYSGYITCTFPELFAGKRMAFYECSKCGVMLLAERFKR